MAGTEEKYSESVDKDSKMNWEKIANCVSHELYPKLANTIRSIITNAKQHGIDSNDLDNHHISKMKSILSTKKVPIEEQEYLEKLCFRARKFIPITKSNRSS